MGVMKTLTINGTTYSVVPIVPALSVTLLANEWVKEGDTYSQVVGVEGVTSHSKVDLQPTPEQLEEFHYKVLAFVAENDGGKVTVYAVGDKPDGDHTIQVTLTEVEGTGKIRGNTVGTTIPRSNLEQDDPTKADYVAGREEFADKVASLARHAAYVTAYGAKGDGSTDDTAAFQDALANERVVFVPGGTYKLSSGLVIRDNCCLELSQDTVLEFTNTIGNCISLGMLSTLKGNHATVKVPYAFEGNVLYAYSNDHTEADQNAVPPWTKWCPQWKSGRYASDLNICKANASGNHESVGGECSGTAVYLSADKTQGMLGFMWGVRFSGLRIAGAFSYGIRAVNYDDGWMHEMRIDDTFIDACEIGVSLEDCNQVYVSAIIQPRPTWHSDKTKRIKYAKHGIQLIRSKNTDLSGSRVWDWDADNTLWTDGGQYQHIAMIGECRGAILNDFYYYENADIDIRKQIYTDMESNLDQMTILQEPITRWFKVKNNEPYYSDGQTEKKLVTQTELDAHFDTDVVKNFTDVLATAIDTDGSIYNGIGYKMGVRANTDGSLVESGYYGTTGYIPCVKGSQIFAENLSFAVGDGFCRLILFDANFNYVMHVNWANLIKGNNYYVGYAETANGFKCTLNNISDLNNVAYARFTIYKTGWGDNPMMSVDEEIKYTVEGFLADGVKVKGENIVGVPGQDTPDWVAKKTESGGNVTVISEQTITSGMWGKRQWDIVPEMVYEVYINGKRYTCKAYNYDGGIILGNYTISLASANVPHNNEPFYIYWAGGSATGGFFGKDSTLSYPITLKVTDNIVTVYDKMPKEYLPDDMPTGGGVDVTAEVGQTIMVEEVDSNGRPTKWKAVDYQPRTHYKDIVELFNATLTGLSEVEVPLEGFSMQAGETYYVTWNGVEYTCVCVEVPDTGGMCLLGNGSVLGLEDTGEPFCIAYGTEDGVTFFTIAISMDGIDEVAVVIKGTGYIPIPTPYLTNALPYYINAVITGTTNGVDQYATSITISEVDALIASGREIKMRMPASSSMPDMVFTLGMFMHGRDENGYVLGFSCSKLYASLANTVMFLIPQADGTYIIQDHFGD